MNTPVLMSGVLIFWLGIYWSLQGLAKIEWAQVSLLPVADDPSAARRMRESTGRHCDPVARPALEQAKSLIVTDLPPERPTAFFRILYPWMDAPRVRIGHTPELTVLFVSSSFNLSKQQNLYEAGYPF